jgi:tRNA-Thr(GGU) m(6)t(6)A37 methyltransferase TsaA
MSGILLTPIAYVRNERKEKSDDHWAPIRSRIELVNELPETCFDGIGGFSHLEVIFHIDRSAKTFIGSEHPREDQRLPRVGIFAQRKKDRPNHLGLTTVELIKHEGRVLHVARLDAIDGTPVLDIKPVFTEFLPQGEVMQPDWTREVMRHYW